MSRPTWWPRNPVGYVFLGQAIDDIGRARFKEWTGAEPGTKHVPLMPASLSDADHWARGHADRLLTEHRPDLPPRGGLYGAVEFTDEQQWAIAFELARRLNSEAAPAIERLGIVHAAIGAACEAGTLLTAVRRPDGQMKECPRQWWNADRLDTRFSRCKLNPNDPFDDRYLATQRDDYLWIFVTLGSLKKMVSAPESRRGGRKPAVDQGLVFEQVARLMDENGEFISGDPEWNAQARLEEKIVEYCKDKFGVDLAASTIRSMVNIGLQRWRSSRQPV